MEKKRMTLAAYFDEAALPKIQHALAVRVISKLGSLSRREIAEWFALEGRIAFYEKHVTLKTVQIGLTLDKPQGEPLKSFAGESQLLLDLQLSVRASQVPRTSGPPPEVSAPLALRASFRGELRFSIENFLLLDLVREDDAPALADYLAALAQKQPLPLGPGLVPDLPGDAQLEAAATWMLARVVPEVLPSPLRLNPHEMARRLDITVLSHRIAANKQIFGEIFFTKTKAPLFNDRMHAYFNRPVGRKTMVVDPSAAYMGEKGSYDNTLVHECIHWLLHRQAMLLKIHTQRKAPQTFCCSVKGGIVGDADPQVQTMEAQTGALVPRLQMPLAPFREKARELLTAYGPFYESWRPERVDVLPLVIDDLAGFFNVSRTAAKLRLIDAGYPDARGAYVHIDGRDLPPHGWTPGALAPGDTFSIPAADAARLLLEDEDFARAAQGYIYLDGHFVLNHPSYVTRSRHDGSWQLTDTARHHMDTCCLVFTLHDADSAPTPRYEHRCLLSQSAEMATVLGYLPHSAPELSQKKLEDMREEAAKTRRMLRNMPGGFTEAFQYALKECGVSQAKLAARTGRSQDTISLNIRQESRAPMEFMVKMCLAANLPPKISEELMKKGGYYLDPDDPLHQIYEVLLTFFYSRPYQENEQFLLEQQRILESA